VIAIASKIFYPILITSINFDFGGTLFMQFAGTLFVISDTRWHNPAIAKVSTYEATAH
jgi:hypothetical protein